MLSTMQDDQLSLATLLRYASTFHGDATVSTWTGDGVRTMTYRELGAESARLANALRGLGIEVGDRVATFMWNNNEHMVAYAAIPAMGAVLHALNLRLFPEQVTYVANHAEDQVVIVDGSLVPMFANYLPTLTTVRHVIVANGDPAELAAPAGVQVHSYTELLAAQPDTYDFPIARRTFRRGYVLHIRHHRRPQGCGLLHRSNVLHAMQVLTNASMGVHLGRPGAGHRAAVPCQCLGFAVRGHAVGRERAHAGPIPAARPAAGDDGRGETHLRRRGADNLGGVLAQLDAQPQDISHLREVVVGGSALPPAMMRAFQDRHGVRLLHAWGMTETSPLGSVAHPPRGVSGEEEWEYRYTQGRFPALVQARLVDDDGSVVPNDGEAVGELEVRGPWITGAYYSPEGASVDPDKFDDGWLRTGDVGKITPDGYLTLVDRTKDVIKSGGEWISSVDLENAVMGHPAVAEASVIGVPDEKWDERPLVAIVLKEGVSAEAAELRDFLADKFAKWQLPERWTFIDEVPKTSVGKFDKKRLRARYADGELNVTTL